MSDSIDQSDGVGGKHGAARQLAEQALRAQASGDGDEADRLFAEANRIDPEAVIAALEERSDEPVNPASDDLGPQDDDEIAAMSRTVEPGSDAPSRSGIGGAGSGGDAQDT